MKRFTLSAIVSFVAVFGVFYLFVLKGEAGQEYLVEPVAEHPEVEATSEKTVSVTDEPTVQGKEGKKKRHPSAAESDGLNVVLKPTSSSSHTAVAMNKEPIQETISAATKPSKVRTYSIQVMSHSQKDKAEKALADIKSKGFTGYIESADVNGTEYHRVKLGPFATKEKAQDVMTDAKEALGYKDAIFSN